mgnify:CR=1 FL=1
MLMWYEVIATCPDGPYRLLTDDYDEALDWAQAQAKLWSGDNVIIHEHHEPNLDIFPWYQS